MSEREALYRAICENPADDLPRLVYADWLDEHGEHDRATFIRVQCELEQLPPASPEAARLQAAHHRLLQRTDWDDVFPLPPTCGWRAERGDYRRGFRWRTQLQSTEAFLRAAADLFQATPAEAVVLSDTSPDGLDMLARSPALARLRGLGIQCSPLRGTRLDSRSSLAALAKSPFGANLTELDLGEGPWSGCGPEVLTYTPLLAQLRKLSLAQLPADCGPILGGERIVHFAVEPAGLSAGDVESLAKSVIPQVRELDLGLRRRVARTTPTAVRTLAESGPFPNLDWLDLSSNPLTVADIDRLIDANPFPNLRGLILRHCGLDTAAVAHLLASPIGRQLTVLDLTGCRMSDERADDLCRADLSQLEWLGLSMSTELSLQSLLRLREHFGSRLILDP